MKQWKMWVLTASILGLTACSGDDVDRVTFEEFAEQVSRSAEDNAVDCGTVFIGESELSANTCVAEAFVNGQAFYAVYQLQGFDSSVGGALSGDGDGEVLEWEYDSNPAGGVPGSSSRIDSTVCDDAELSGTLELGYADVFDCGQTGSTDDDPADVVTIEFDEFVEQVSQSAGDDAVDCGVVGIGESQVSVNTCVAEAFVNGQAFFAAYELQGIDSTVGAALSGDSDGDVLLWEYDSNPAGGVPASSSRVDSSVCVDAELSGSLDTGYEDVFSCADEA